MRTLFTIALLLVTLAVLVYGGVRLATSFQILDAEDDLIANYFGIAPEPEPVSAADVPAAPAAPTATGASVVIDGIPPGFENVEVEEGAEKGPGLTAEEQAAVQQVLNSDPRLRGRAGYGDRVQADRAFLGKPSSVGGAATPGGRGRGRGDCGLKKSLESTLQRGADRRMPKNLR